MQGWAKCWKAPRREGKSLVQILFTTEGNEENEGKKGVRGTCQTHTQIRRKWLRGQGIKAHRTAHTSCIAKWCLQCAWCLLNLYKQREDRGSDVFSGEAVMTQHDQAADSNLFPETYTHTDMTLHVPMTPNLSAYTHSHTQYISSWP